jgi:hypothetical protein
MLFIKLYYYVFFAFIYLLVGVCEVVKWLLNPRFNWAGLRQMVNKMPLPLLQGMRPKAEQF